MFRSIRVVAGALILIALSALWLWHGAAAPDQPAVAIAAGPEQAQLLDRDSANSGPDLASALPPRQHSLSATDAQRQSGWPASLQGSTPDGEVLVGADGRVIPGIGLRRLFDYFLSTIGELDVPAIRALLLAHVRDLHGAAVAQEVAGLFDQYIDYQRALSDAESLLPRDLQARLEFAKQLRRRHFDAASAEAFFGEEEAYAEYTLERMRIARDTALDEAERTAQLKALEATLSASQLASMREARSAQLIEEQSRQFEALAVDPGARFDERSALYGEAAATRLADLDRERAAWEQRVLAYRQARDAIQRNAAFSAQQRAQAIAELRSRSFDAHEARRIQSLEAIGQI